MLSLWLVETASPFAVYPDLSDELLALIYKLSQSQSFAALLKQHRLIKVVIEASKDTIVSGEVKRMAVHIVRQVNGKGGLGSKAALDYIPSALQDSSLALLTL